MSRAIKQDIKFAVVITAACVLCFYIGARWKAEKLSVNESALAAETKLEACEIEVRTVKGLLEAEMKSRMEAEVFLERCLADCGAQAEAEARQLQE
ncbi:MAG: hypothetical protein GY906_22280 [bacterium]|nr:hypothetical protein [bacterium]